MPLILSALVLLCIFVTDSRAEQLGCFSSGDLNKIFTELAEHRQSCPLIQAELTATEERLAIAEREIENERRRVEIYREEVALRDKHIEQLKTIAKDELDKQERQCKDAIKNLKPTFWETVKDMAIKVGVGILIGVAIAL